MSNDVPVVVPTYVGFAPKLDGKISDQVWSGVQRVTDFQLLGSEGPATQQTEVRICYDRNNLYVSFECFEDRMDEIDAKFTDDDSPVWQDDSIELFISPYSVTDTAKCHQFVVNAAGAKAYLRPDWVRPKETWRAATVRLKDRWVVEIAVPFDTLRPLGRNDNCWRINFCRNEHPHSETSSWAPVTKWFRTYSQFGKLVPPVAPFVFTTFRSELTPMEADGTAASGTQLVEGDVIQLRSEESIIPEPQEVHNRVSKAPFVINSETRIVINDEATEADLWTVGEINAAIERLGGKPLSVENSSAANIAPDQVNNVIVIGESARNGLLRAICEQDEVRMPRSRFGTGTHVIDVLPHRAVIVGSSIVDTYYGAQTLKQIIKLDRDGSLYIPSMGIRDYARFTFRGVHLLTSRDALPYIGKLIENVLAPLKINNIVLQTDEVAWESHPEILDDRNFMPREDIKKLIEIAKRHHITITPLVQSPGHLEWAYRHNKNLDFAEDPEHPYCYCMSNPKSYDFIFSIMDEAIELFGNPEYLHAGRDEFDMIGRLPMDEECKAAGKERLYVDDTLKIYQHLRSRGCKMMMWGDVLYKPEFREYIKELPIDIMINDWHYAPSDTFPSLDFFQSNGFTTLGCAWYDPRNIWTFAGYAARRGIQGMLQTTWTGWKSEAETLRDHPDQVFAYVLAAAWSWNPVKPNVDDLPYRPEVVFNNLWKQEASPRPASFRVVNIDRYCNISRIDSGRTPGWLGIGRGNDLRGMPDGLLQIEDVPYKIIPGRLDQPSVILLGGEGMTRAFPRSVEGIVVDLEVSSLHLLQGCAYSADEATRIGRYVIHYEDGETDAVDLNYRKNIFAWDDQSAGMSYGFAWRGRAQDGRAVGVCDLKWENPRPNVKVTGIDLIAEPTEASPFVLAITAEI